jgi:hypothetical protein
MSKENAPQPQGQGAPVQRILMSTLGSRSFQTFELFDAH